MRSKKFIIVYAIAIFLIVVLITVNAVCSVSQFEVTGETGSAFGEARVELVQNRLDEEYRGKSYLFFQEESVYDIVAQEGGGYLEVVSVQKHFPNKVSVRVHEKYETFAFEKDGKYYVIGDDGTVLAVKDENVSNIPGTNLEVVGFSFDIPSVGDVFTVDPACEDAYKSLQIFYAALQERGLSDNAIRLEYDSMGASDPNFNFSWFYVDTVEGVHFWIDNPGSRMSEKVKMALDIYDGLQEGQRTYGYISVMETGIGEGSTGQITASFSEDVPPIERA